MYGVESRDGGAGSHGGERGGGGVAAGLVPGGRVGMWKGGRASVELRSWSEEEAEGGIHFWCCRRCQSKGTQGDISRIENPG